MGRPVVMARKLKKAKIPRKKIKRSTSLAMVKARARKGIKRSGIEELTEKWLKDAGIPVQTQHRISRIHVDLAVIDREHRIAIEVQGCYFHGCRKCYPGKVASDIIKKRARDSKRFTFIVRCGYHIIPVWEHDILGKPEETRKGLIAEIRSFIG